MEGPSSRHVQQSHPCQKYVAQIIDPFRISYPDLYDVHYIDEILIAGPDIDQLYFAGRKLVNAPQNQGLQVFPEKIQIHHPHMFLGFELFPNKILSQKVQVRQDSLQTLNDFQRLLGDINWLRPYLKLTTGELKPLFDILRGDPDPSSPRMLTQEARRSLAKVEQAISEQNIGYFSPRASTSAPCLPYSLFTYRSAVAAQTSVLGPHVSFSLQSAAHISSVSC